MVGPATHVMRLDMSLRTFPAWKALLLLFADNHVLIDTSPLQELRISSVASILYRTKLPPYRL